MPDSLRLGDQVRVIADSSSHYKCVGKVFAFDSSGFAALVDFEPEKPAGDIAPVFFMIYELELVK